MLSFADRAAERHHACRPRAPASPFAIPVGLHAPVARARPSLGAITPMLAVGLFAAWPAAPPRWAYPAAFVGGDDARRRARASRALRCRWWSRHPRLGRRPSGRRSPSRSRPPLAARLRGRGALRGRARLRPRARGAGARRARYAAGFVLATAALHGVGLGRRASRPDAEAAGHRPRASVGWPAWRGARRSPLGCVAMIPGEYLPRRGRDRAERRPRGGHADVANTGDRPVQVGSHYHFAETNRRARPSTAPPPAAAGSTSPPATAVRFEPGQTREVRLIPTAARGASSASTPR